MRHKVRGRKLGRNAAHRRAMFRNMASSLLRTLRVDPADPASPKHRGRIVTTVAKAKELRRFVEKLVTMARKARRIEQQAAQFGTDAVRGSDAWRQWRESEQWQRWNQAIAPAIALRRRAFALLRDKEALDILFTEVAERFADRDGGYTRVVRLAEYRLGDAGQKAIIEFVGEHDRRPRERTRRPAQLPVAEETTSGEMAGGDGEPDNDQATATVEQAAESSRGEPSGTETAEGSGEEGEQSAGGGAA
ncbi:MAG: 50S ribosomal protein L17 [Planctomycetota bacterium]|nr:MAG: 50S ribosomal protein L17 [Planctomycetota bacterium]